MRFIVIGITDSRNQRLSNEVKAIVGKEKVFSGGKRHHEIVGRWLPDNAQWIDIVAPIDVVFEKYRALESATCGMATVVVFASGDPLFFGFANTIRRLMPDAEIEVHAVFNSLQMLAHKLVMGYEDMCVVSLTGRPWEALDQALIRCEKKIGILTDREHTPAAIAGRMREYGYTDYRMYVGSCLGNEKEEQIWCGDVGEGVFRDQNHLEVVATEFPMPNCVILVAKRQLERKPMGTDDHLFTRLDGRERMITKMPVRLLSLQAMELHRRRVMWDIGFCTGSVSIEARLLFPHLHIEAFEIRPEGETLMQENSRRMGAPGIVSHIGDFLEMETMRLPRPDAVFIGGHGGRLYDILYKVKEVLAYDGCIVMNSVSSAVADKITGRRGSRELWDEACQRLGLQQEEAMRIVLNDNNPIEILKCKKLQS